MKIICPEHNGPIDLSDNIISEAVDSPSQSINCPVCKIDGIIHHVPVAYETVKIQYQ